MKSNFSFLVLALLFTSTVAICQTHTWTNTSGDMLWSNPENWSAGTVPDTTSDVLIDGDFIVDSATSNNSGTITIQNNAKLIVSSDITVTSNININQGEIDVLDGGEIRHNGATIVIEQGAKLIVEGDVSSTSSGTIVNSGTIEVTGNSVVNFENQLIENHGTILVTTTGITNLLDVTLNNNVDGVIEILGIGGFLKQDTSSVLNNFGLLVKRHADGTNGNFYIITEINNYGIIDIEENETFLLLSNGDMLTNFPEGKMIGEGTYDITTNFLNQGTISPGDSFNTATIEVVNTFSINEGIIEIDLNMNTHDRINVTGSSIMDGTILITSSELFPIDTEFDIITSSFDIDSCSFPPFVSYEFDDGTFIQFEVECNTNTVTLRVESVSLVGFDDVLDSQEFTMTPNPMTTETRFLFASEIVTQHSPSIEMYTMQGQKVKSFPAVSETTVFKRNNLASGIYLVKVVSEEKILATRKLILE